jgi:hypothetical protein
MSARPETLSAAPTTPLEIAGGFLHEAPVDVLGMAQALGLSVDMQAPLSPEISGRITRTSAEPPAYRIEVNGAHSERRKRFTLAHEIAHYLLHRDLIGDGIEDDALYRSHLSNENEAEANRLAARILMPPELVLKIYRAGVKSLSGLCGAFEVSEEAMRIRLKQLRLAP